MPIQTWLRWTGDSLRVVLRLLPWAASGLLAEALLASPAPVGKGAQVSMEQSLPQVDASSEFFASGFGAIAPKGKQIAAQGDRIVINGVRLSVPWVQWQDSEVLPTEAALPSGRASLETSSATYGLSDLALRSLGGIELLDTTNSGDQPIVLRQSLLQNESLRLNLPALVTPQVRYLELTPLQEAANWSVRVDGESLRIQTGSILQTANLLLGRSLGHRFYPQDIQWSPELRWQQDYVRVGGAEFPVTRLAVQLGQGDLAVSLSPIWPSDDSLPGIEPLPKTVAQAQIPKDDRHLGSAQSSDGTPATAAINGGFFNRKNQTPLGAIRQGGDWISGPILNRGAIAWNNQGSVAMGRLRLEETLTAQHPDRPKPDRSKPDVFNVIALNSGYLKAGFSRYDAAWGKTYIPLTDNEVLIYVKAGAVVEQRDAAMAGEGRFPIPVGDSRWTYLLVARSNRTGAAKLPVGTKLSLAQQVFPGRLSSYPQALGAGPLLLLEGEIVLDALAEGFSKAFAEQRAVRSAIASFGEGRIALVTVHDRIGGKGPSLQELAQLLQSLGAVDALNLDGGSSTQLLLGEQIIDRDPRSAAQVHNGLGIFR